MENITDEVISMFAKKATKAECERINAIEQKCAWWTLLQDEQTGEVKKRIERKEKYVADLIVKISLKKKKLKE